MTILPVRVLVLCRTKSVLRKVAWSAGVLLYVVLLFLFFGIFTDGPGGSAQPLVTAPGLPPPAPAPIPSKSPAGDAAASEKPPAGAAASSPSQTAARDTPSATASDSAASDKAKEPAPKRYGTKSPHSLKNQTLSR